MNISSLLVADLFEQNAISSMNFKSLDFPSFSWIVILYYKLLLWIFALGDFACDQNDGENVKLFAFEPS